jgi:hypothetical protein
MPDVRTTFYYSDPQDPATAVGITTGDSYTLTGESKGSVTMADVASVRNQLAELQSLSSAAIKLVVRVAMLEEERRRIREHLIPGSLPTDGQMTRNVELWMELSNLRGQLKAIDDEIKKLNSELRTSTAKAGIMIARWSAQRNEEGEVHAGTEAASARSSFRQTANFSGLIVLGDVRIVYHVFGTDDRTLFGDRDKAEDRVTDGNGLYPDELAHTTFLLQAKHVGYVSDSERLLEVAFQAELDLEKLASSSPAYATTAQIRLRYYLSSIETLANSGMLSEFSWARSGPAEQGGQYAGDQGWVTVVARSVSPRRRRLDAAGRPG